MTPPSQIIGRATHQLAGIGSALAECATLMSEIHPLLPQGGELVEDFKQLAGVLAWIENAYRDADEHLLAAYEKLEHQEQREREGWTPIPLDVDKIEAQR